MLNTGELLIGTGDGVVCRANQIELIMKDPSKKMEDKSSKNKKSKLKTEMRLKEAQYVFHFSSIIFIKISFVKFLKINIYKKELL